MKDIAVLLFSSFLAAHGSVIPEYGIVDHMPSSVFCSLLSLAWNMHLNINGIVDMGFLFHSNPTHHILERKYMVGKGRLRSILGISDWRENRPLSSY